MALTVTPVKVYVEGDRKEVIADIAFDNSYATGGLAITPALLKLEHELTTIIPMAVTTAAVISLNKSVVYDYVSGKLALLVAGAEPVNASDQSTVKVRVRAVGKGSVTV